MHHRRTVVRDENEIRKEKGISSRSVEASGMIAKVRRKVMSCFA